MSDILHTTRFLGHRQQSFWKQLETTRLQRASLHESYLSFLCLWFSLLMRRQTDNMQGSANSMTFKCPKCNFCSKHIYSPNAVKVTWHFLVF